MKRMMKNLVESKNYSKIKEILLDMNQVDIAEILGEIESVDALKIFRLMPKDLAADVFAHLNSDMRQQIIETATDKEIKNIIEESFFSDVVDLIEEMPAIVVKKIMRNTNKKERKLINRFLNYPEDSAGSLMTIEYIGLKEDMTVEEAKKYIRKADVEEETADVCFVTDKTRILKGTLPIRRLILEDDDMKIKDLMDSNVIPVVTYDDQEDVANLFRKYDLIAAPVVDKEERLVGIITIDDIVDVIEQENTEDFQKIAGMTPSDEGYLESNVVKLATNRIWWLLVLMISATFAGNIIKRYDEILESTVILVSFIPMLMGTGGNSRSQASTLVIRGMALEQIRTKDILKVIWKELRISILVGFVLSGANFLRIVYVEKVEYQIAFVVCITLFVTVVAAKILGGSLPIIAKKLKLDPAIMASPLITTILDVLVLFVYMNIAKIMLGL